MSRQACQICKIEKDISGFYMGKRGRYETRCKDCHKRTTAEHNRRIYATPEGRAQADKRYKRALSRGSKLETFQRQREKSPEKYKARYTLRNAVAYGWISK